MRASSSSAASSGSRSSPSSSSTGSMSRDFSSSRAAIRTRNSVAASRSSSPARSRCSTYASTTSARSTSRRSISSFSTSVRSRSKGPWKTSRSRSSEAIAIAGRLVVQTDGLVVLAFAVALLHRLRRIALPRRGARGDGLLDAQQIVRGELQRGRLVGPQREVPLASWRQPRDDRLAHGFLERAVALARELALDLIRRDLTRHGHHLDQVRDPLLAGAPDDVRAGVGLGALDLPADRVGLVVDVDQACVAAVARGHLGRGVLEVHNPGPDLRNDGPRLDEHVRIARVEAPRDLTRQLDVLALVFPYRHLVGLVEQDVGGLEHRVEEQAGAHELLLARRLVLELVHALQVAVG